MSILKIVTGIFVLVNLFSFVSYETYNKTPGANYLVSIANSNLLSRDSFVNLRNRYSCVNFEHLSAKTKDCQWVFCELNSSESDACLGYLLTVNVKLKERNCYIISKNKMFKCITNKFSESVDSLFFIHLLEGEPFQYFYEPVEHATNKCIVLGVGENVTSGLLYRGVPKPSGTDKNQDRYEKIFNLFSKLKKSYVKKHFREVPWLL